MKEIDPKAKKCPFCQSDQRNWFARHKIITGIIIVIIFFSIIGAAGSSKSGTSVPATSDNSNANAGANSNTQATAGPTKAPQALLNLTGSGTKSTQTFTAGGDWDLDWTYDCSNFGNQGNFQVMIYNKDGTMSTQLPVNQLGSKDSGVEHYHSGGSYYLEVNSECSWTVNVQG